MDGQTHGQGNSSLPITLQEWEYNKENIFKFAFISSLKHIFNNLQHFEARQYLYDLKVS